MSFDNELISEFIIESLEGLDRLDEELLKLENDPNDTGTINSIFRIVHTIKGTCGFLDFKILESISHKGENLLDSLRAERISFSTDIATALLNLGDALRSILGTIEETGSEGEEHYDALVQTLISLNDPNAKPQQGAAAEDVSVAPSLSEDTSSEPPLETSASENEILEEATPLPEVSQVGEAQEDSEEVSQLLADISKGLEKHRTPEAPSETTEAPVDAGSTEDLLASLFDGDSSESGQVPEELQADQETEEESVEVAGDEEVETSEAESDFVNHDLIAEVLGDTSIPWAGGEQASDSFEANEETPVQSLEVAEPMLAQEEESTNEQQNVAPVEEEVLMETPTEAILPEEEKVVEVQASAPKALEATQSVPVPEPKSTAPEPKSTTMSQSTTVDQEAQKLVKSEKAPLSKSSIADSSLRVDVELLDSLMNLVGELVLARNQILQFTKMNGESNANFTNTCQRLNLITSELQEGVMKTRMQPIANVWNKFPRIIRDIARACGKEIQVDMEGKDTDLDKTILEAIKDPLTHIVRNAADHGIETPEVREANGKSREGTLLLSAYHEGGHVIIEIVDDGAGLNTERIREKAIEKGVISAEKAGRMSEQELQRLIFAPGFSTAEQVTNISGRGVGMDVVRSNIEKIGGSVDIQSILGEGTTLKIKIPLTLAIVPALMISAGDQRFAIPQVSLLELLRIEGDKIDTQIEEIHGSLFYRLRGDLLPLVYLSHELQMTHLQLDEEARKKTNKAINVVVVRADEKEFGLVVDVVHDTEEIVVKPLGRQLKNIEVFAGATILGDGKVALILDILGLGKKAHVIRDMKESSNHHDEAGDGESGSEDRESLLLVRVGENQRLAIPLVKVDRLEEFTGAVVEQASGRMVVQYRGGILPLINLSNFFNKDKTQCCEYADDDLVNVIVFRCGTRAVGFIVGEILDIVHEALDIQYAQGREGILGSAVVQKKITDVLDTHTVLQILEPRLLEESESQQQGA